MYIGSINKSQRETRFQKFPHYVMRLFIIRRIVNFVSMHICRYIIHIYTFFLYWLCTYVILFFYLLDLVWQCHGVIKLFSVIKIEKYTITWNQKSGKGMGHFFESVFLTNGPHNIILCKILASLEHWYEP